MTKHNMLTTECWKLETDMASYYGKEDWPNEKWKQLLTSQPV